MKTILLPINDDNGAEARLQVSLDLARAFGGHVDALQVTPLTAFVALDSFGGVYVMTDVMEQVRATEARLRGEVEARMAREGISWAYEHCDGEPAATIVDRSRLADVVVLSPAVKEPRPGEPLPLAGDVAVHGRTPVLVVPADTRGLQATGTALVAWNGSDEGAQALKAALPLLKLAGKVVISTVVEPDPDRFPATDACTWLSRHGVGSELVEVPAGSDGVTAALLGTREKVGADYVVMGAYGHSRLREAVLGGVTRGMLRHCPVPLFLAH